MLVSDGMRGMAAFVPVGGRRGRASLVLAILLAVAFILRGRGSSSAGTAPMVAYSSPGGGTAGRHPAYVAPGSDASQRDAGDENQQPATASAAPAGTGSSDATAPASSPSAPAARPAWHVEPLVNPPDEDPAGTPEALARTAFVTYIMGDTHARMAVALMQSLRDSATRVPHLVVLVSPGNTGGAECESRKREQGLPHEYCMRSDAPIVDMISNVYIRALVGLRVHLIVAPPVPRTPYSNNIAGGHYHFWGAALNKLNVLKLTQYRKVVWMDSDTIALQNLDHLLSDGKTHPTGLVPDPDTGVLDEKTGLHAFTAAFTVNCCAGVRGKVGGSLWVFQPSEQLYQQVWDMSNKPCPVAADPATGTWHEGDQQIVSFVIAKPKWDRPGSHVKDIELWPFLEDFRQGVVPGLQYLPPYQGMDDVELMETVVRWDLHHRFPPAVYGPGGVFPDFVFNLSTMQGLLPRKYWPDSPAPGTPVWHPLDTRYDIMVGSCDCKSHLDLAGRIEQDRVGVQMTAHYSCIQPPLEKPGAYVSDAALQDAMYRYGASCIRWYYSTWYGLFKKALSQPGVLPAMVGRYNKDGSRFELFQEWTQPGLPPPLYTGPAVPGLDKEHDANVVTSETKKWRESQKRGRRLEGSGGCSSCCSGDSGSGSLLSGRPPARRLGQPHSGPPPASAADATGATAAASSTSTCNATEMLQARVEVLLLEAGLD